jgi:hypothetical protein
MKKCQNCTEFKTINSFYKSKTCSDGYSIICKSCHLSKYYIKSPNKKECRVCHIKVNENNGINSGHKRKDGSIIYKSICKSCDKPRKNIYQKQRRENDPLFKLYGNIKSRINSFLKFSSYKKSDSFKTLKLLDCNLIFYKQYLEQQFTSEMNWDNYGSYWEIDHIYPLSKGGSFHYTNTQPLKVNDNRVKYNKI